MKLGAVVPKPGFLCYTAASMVILAKFKNELAQLEKVMAQAKRVLITAPGAADGDSIGSQLALRRMFLHRFPQMDVKIINDEPLPHRYRFLPDIEHVYTPDTLPNAGKFDVALIVDGGIDRAGRVRELFESAPTTVLIDHHAISVSFPYTIRIVDSTASSNTELIYHISQMDFYKTPVGKEFAQFIYLGLVFDTGFFRHANTTPEAMELAASLIRTGFDFTRVGERGMLERSCQGLRLLSDTLAHADFSKDRKIVWSIVTQDKLKSFHAESDDREGIIDHLFLTEGIEVAVLFIELPDNKTKISLRSHGKFDVARFARSLTVCGGGHCKAAGANLDEPVSQAVPSVLLELESVLKEARA